MTNRVAKFLGRGHPTKDEDFAPCSPAAHSRLTSDLQLEQVLLPAPMSKVCLAMSLLCVNRCRQSTTNEVRHVGLVRDLQQEIGIVGHGERVEPDGLEDCRERRCGSARPQTRLGPVKSRGPLNGSRGRRSTPVVRISSSASDQTGRLGASSAGARGVFGFGLSSSRASLGMSRNAARRALRAALARRRSHRGRRSPAPGTAGASRPRRAPSGPRAERAHQRGDAIARDAVDHHQPDRRLLRVDERVVGIARRASRSPACRRACRLQRAQRLVPFEDGAASRVAIATRSRALNRPLSMCWL